MAETSNLAKIKVPLENSHFSCSSLSPSVAPFNAAFLCYKRQKSCWSRDKQFTLSPATVSFDTVGNYANEKFGGIFTNTPSNPPFTFRPSLSEGEDGGPVLPVRVRRDR